MQEISSNNNDNISFNDHIFLNNTNTLVKKNENVKEIKSKTSQVENKTDSHSASLFSTSSILNTQQRCSLSSWDLPEAILEKYKSRGLETMFGWQAECLNNPKVLLKNKNLVYSAPTSAGKTLVAEILALKTVLERRKKVIIILPFVSVVREKMFYFKEILSTSGVRVDGFMGSYNPPGGFKMVQFAICTIEKANGIVNKALEEQTLDEIGAIVIDEMHLLGDSSRGYLLELLLTKLLYMSRKNKKLTIQLIGMSATLPNLDLLSKWLNAELYTTDFRPVPLHERCMVNGEIYNTELKLLRKLTPIPDLSEDTDKILRICLETISNSCSILIFCPTKNWCENLAQQISVAFWKLGCSKSTYGQLLRTQLSTERITEILEQLERSPVGLDVVLKKTVSFGVAFHHAGLTMEERDIIEAGFRNGGIRALVATSTLSAGVNLPARRVIIRTPMFHGKPIDTLVYRQMIGRAGRMGKDSEGESILVCQKNDKKVAMDLMSAKLNPIESCLEESGRLKRAILEVIASGVATTPEEVNLFANCTLLAASETNFNEERDPIGKTVEFLEKNEFIRLQNEKDGLRYIPTLLARACLSSSLPPEDGLNLFEELEKARRCFVLDTELHLLYLVTPYSVCYQWTNLDWMSYLNMWEKLSASDKRVADLVGVRESFIFNATRGKINTNSTKSHHKLQIHKRFYTALALQDLINEVPLNEVAQKFQCSRGLLQSLQQSASTFAGMVTAFSRQLGWNCVEILISQFQDRLQFGIHHELLDLLKLPLLNGPRARILFNSDIKSLIDLASFDVCKLENILHSSVPFQSEKEREGETEHDVNQKKKLKNIWITGKEGLTAKEAAFMLIEDARGYLEYEMGAKVNWDRDLSDTSHSILSSSESDVKKSRKKKKSRCKRLLKKYEKTKYTNKELVNSKETKLSKIHSDTILSSTDSESEGNRSSRMIKIKKTNIGEVSRKYETKNEKTNISTKELERIESPTSNANVNIEMIDDRNKINTTLKDNQSLENILEEYSLNINSVSPNIVHETSEKIINNENLDDFNITSEDILGTAMFAEETVINLNETQNEINLKLASISISEEIKLTNDQKLYDNFNNNHFDSNLQFLSFNDIHFTNENTVIEDILQKSEPNHDWTTFSNITLNDSLFEKEMDVTNHSSICDFSSGSDSLFEDSNLDSKLCKAFDDSAKFNHNKNISNESNYEINNSNEILFSDFTENIPNTQMCTSDNLKNNKCEIVENFSDHIILIDETEKPKIENNMEISDNSIFEQAFASSFNTKIDHCLSPNKTKENEQIDEVVDTSQSELVNDTASLRKEKKKSGKKRRKKENNSFDNLQTPTKKIKTFSTKNDLLEIVDVTNNQRVFDIFSFEIKKQTQLSIAVGCKYFAQDKPKIGQKLIKTPKTGTNENTSEFIFGNRCISGISIYWGVKVYFISFRNTEHVGNKSKIHLLNDVFNNDKLRICIFDVKEHYKVLYKACGIKINCQFEDVKVADWLLEPEDLELNLPTMVLNYAPEVEYYTNMVGHFPRYGSVALFGDNTISSQLRASVEAIIIWHVMKKQKELLFKENPILSATFDIEVESIICLIQIELNGLGIDSNKIKKLVHIVQEQISLIEKQAFTLAGRKFNFASSKDIAKALGIYNGKKITTNKKALEKIENPLSNLVLQWRKLNSILTKMLFPVLRSLKNNRIYGTCITRTATGRISMHEPNLQTIPRNFDLIHLDKTVIPISIRSAFIPTTGKVFLSADYCQLELRLLAHLSQDPTLCNIMKSDEDIFKSIASKLYKITNEEVEDVMRQRAKQLCYGIIYGMGAKALSDQLQSTEDEAKVFMENFINTYPYIKEYIQKTVENCREKGYVETMAKRKRYLSNINHQHSGVRSQAERQAVNTTIQGSAADLAKKAMVLVDKQLKICLPSKDHSESRVAIILHIHDELLYETELKDLKTAARLLKTTMESVVDLSVPFPVKIKYGHSWGEMNELVDM